MAHCTAKGKGSHPPEYNRRMRFLHRSRQRLHATERDKLPVIRRLRVTPDGLYRLQILNGPRSFVLKANPERVEFRLEIPDAYPKDQPAIREHVETRQLFGQY